MKKLLLFCASCLVLGSASAQTWTKVTSTNDITFDGEYVIACADESSLMGVQTSTTTFMPKVSVSNWTDKTQLTQLPEGTAVVKFEGTDLKSAKLHIYTVDGISKDYYTTTAAKKMSLTDTGTAANVSINTSGNVVINFGTTPGTLYYNKNSPRFLNYTSTQTAIQLYKKSGSEPAPELKPAGLEFTESEKTVNIGEEFTLSVTNPNSLEVIYVSSNPEVATVDSNGTVKALAKGSTTITATSEATEEFEAGKAEYSLSVIDPDAPEQDYNFTVTGLENNKAVVVFSPAVNVATFTTAKNNGGTNPVFNTNGSDLRIYAKGSLTISVPEGVVVSKIVFNISDQGLKRLAPITASVGTIATQSSDDKTVTWTGNVSNGKIELTVGDKADYGTEDTKAGQLCFGSGTITAEFVKQPTVPVISVKDGDEITDGVLDLEKGTKTIVIAVAEGHELWYKVSEIDETVEAQNADTLADDFIKAETNPAEIELTKNGSVEYYSVLNGVSSPVQTLKVTGANTTAIAEVGAEANVAAEWFDMQGRRVAVPAKGGVYILKQGSKTSKRAL